MTRQTKYDGLSAPDVAHLVSQELCRLCEKITQVELGIVQICELSNEKTIKKAAPSLQELDFAIQSTRALANYMAEFSNLVNDNGPLDLDTAISSVPIRDLALRLSGLGTKNIKPSLPELF